MDVTVCYEIFPHSKLCLVTLTWRKMPEKERLGERLEERKTQVEEGEQIKVIRTMEKENVFF